MFAAGTKSLRIESSEAARIVRVFVEEFSCKQGVADHFPIHGVADVVERNRVGIDAELVLMTGADRLTDGEVDLMRDHPVRVEIVYVLLVRGEKDEGEHTHDKIAIEVHPLITACHPDSEILGQLDFAKAARAVSGRITQYV